MSQLTLEDRLSALESQLLELRTELQKLAQPKDWRSAIGMFAGDEFMERVFENARKIREADRRRARQRFSKTRRKTKAKAKA